MFCSIFDLPFRFSHSTTISEQQQQKTVVLSLLIAILFVSRLSAFIQFVRRTVFFFFNFSSADVVFVFSEFYFVQCIRLTKLLQDHAPCSHANSILPLKPFNLFIKPHGKNESGHAVYAVTFTCNNARKMTMCHDFFFRFFFFIEFFVIPFYCGILVTSAVPTTPAPFYLSFEQ